ncbi:MAG: GNAT family N-acetyltransferase [Betaproteobacteria bacterium]|nr:GNAT family N-acetyltransferase [Betaproteobacteria bacterium]
MNPSAFDYSKAVVTPPISAALLGSSTPVPTRNAQYEVSLAQAHELDELFALRYDVFLAAHDAEQSTMKDMDKYDSLADHLIVKSNNRIIATYRLLPTDRVLNAGLIPYSANEFDLSGLLEMCDPRETVELGRSCVHPAHRNGSVPKILWSALAKYMIEHGRSDAFGSVSVFNANHCQAVGLVEYFRDQGAWSETIQCPALVPVHSNSPARKEELKTVVPPLLRSYLMLGAKLYGGPSHDPVFRSHDFLIHFSTKTMSDRCRRSFFSSLG